MFRKSELEETGNLKRKLVIICCSDSLNWFANKLEEKGLLKDKFVLICSSTLFSN